MPNRSRKYASRKKTTTQDGFREYQRNLMRTRLDVDPARFGVRGRKPRRFLVKDFAKDLEKLRQRMKKP